MHELSIPADLVTRVTERTGRPHPFDVIDPAKTAFVVVDMQNYFMKPGFQGEVPKARAIVPRSTASPPRCASWAATWCG
jgi:hypothetical protein